MCMATLGFGHFNPRWEISQPRTGCFDGMKVLVHGACGDFQQTIPVCAEFVIFLADVGWASPLSLCAATIATLMNESLPVSLGGATIEAVFRGTDAVAT